MVLEPIYEQDFLDCSYGFRPGRSAHQALESFRNQLMNCRGGWVLEVDIRKFFDTLDHGHLRTFLRLRVRDGVLLRLIGKWLKAGVMEDGSVSYPEAGSPQGGVISPLLSNVFLHYVLDVWFEQEVKPRLRRRAFLIRYADDFVIGFRDERDAQRVMEVLPKRFGKYGLTVHPDKTRLVPFRPPSSKRRTTSGNRGRPVLGRSTCWDSPTTGGGRSEVTGWSSRRRRPTDSAEQCGASTQWCQANRHLLASGAAAEAEREATRSLRVLRGHGQLGGLVAVPLGSRATLAEVALSPQPQALDDLGRFRRMLQRYPLAPARTVRSVYEHAANP